MIRNEIRHALEATGRKWEIRPGKKHYKIIVGDRMVAVLPHGPKMEMGRHGFRNLLATIKRAGRGQAV